VIRKRIWDLLEERDIARSPRPVHHRIPNFDGADAAAARLAREVPEFGAARLVKVGAHPHFGAAREDGGVCSQPRRVTFVRRAARRGLSLIDRAWRGA